MSDLLLSNKIWYEKYAPHTIDQCFLSKSTKKLFNKYIKDKEIPNLIFSGPSGIGKTTAANVLIDSIGADRMLIPAGTKGNIDTLRNEITQFASTLSFNGGKKYIIIDEADSLTHVTQGALRGFIDEFSSNCGFIFTCNFREKIIDPLSESRLTNVSFTLDPNDLPDIAKQLFVKVVNILQAENITYVDKDIQHMILQSVKQNTDFRRLFNTLQKSCQTGEFNVEQGFKILDQRFKDLIQVLKSKDFNQVRQWVAVNADIDAVTVMRSLYDNNQWVTKTENKWVLIAILSQHMHQHATAIDAEINLMGCMAAIIKECI